MNCCGEVRGALCHCARCHQTFGTLEVFDLHQDVSYKRSPMVVCNAPEGLGLVRDTWGTWRTPEDATATTARVGKMLSAKREKQ
jgi:hypothetical protein